MSLSLLSSQQHVQRAFAQGAQPLKRSRAACRGTSHDTIAPTCAAQQGGETSRRQALHQLAGTLAAAQLLDVRPAAAKVPKGFSELRDTQDGYSFVYPFGWQEVSVDGLDVVFKDVIEPLESVSVSFIPTEKKDVSEFGDAKEVAYTLADRVLTAPTQAVTLVDAAERVVDGRRYFDFEFTAQSKAYTRHALASVTVGNGRFYTLETGANERRWSKVKDKVKSTQQSFVVVDRY